MPSSPTPLGNLELQAAGENLNTWGQPKLNNVITQLTEYIAGAVSFTLSGAKTLTSTNYATNEARQMILLVTGGTGGTVTIPGQSKVYVVRNGASGSVTITAGATGAVVSAGQTMWVFCDGTDCFVIRPTDFGSSLPFTTGVPSLPTHLVNKSYADGLAFSTALPGQAGNAGKFVKTDGSVATWENVTTTDIVGLAAELLLKADQADLDLTNIALGALNTAAEKIADRATTSVIRSNAQDKHVATNNAWSSLAIVTLTDGATITPDMSTFINAEVTLGGNRTIAAPTNTKVGQTGTIYFIQDGTGNRTATFDSVYKFANGVKTLSTGAGAIDSVHYKVRSSTYIECSLVKAPS